MVARSCAGMPVSASVATPSEVSRVRLGSHPVIAITQSLATSVVAPVSARTIVAVPGPSRATRDPQCIGISPLAMRLSMSGRTHGLTPRSKTSRKCTMRTRTPLRYSSSVASTAELPPPTTVTSWSKNGYGSL